MSYDSSSIDKLSIAIKEILDETALILDRQYFVSFLEEMKVAETLLKPIYDRVESLAAELADSGSAMAYVSTELSPLIDKTLIDVMKTNNLSDLYRNQSKAKYFRLVEETNKADKLRRSLKDRKSLVEIVLMIQDKTVFDEDEPIRVSIRFNSDSSVYRSAKDLYIDYTIDRNTFVVTLIQMRSEYFFFLKKLYFFLYTDLEV